MESAIYKKVTLYYTITQQQQQQQDVNMILRWPKFIKLFEQHSVSSWYTEVKYVFDLIKRCHALLADMSPKFYKRYELSDSDLIQWKDIMNEHPLAHRYLVNELMPIVNNKSIIQGINVVPIKYAYNYLKKYSIHDN